jgi:hypothetical protein
VVKQRNEIKEEQCDIKEKSNAKEQKDKQSHKTGDEMQHGVQPSDQHSAMKSWQLHQKLT